MERSASSGLVSRPRMRDMTSERFSGVKTSMGEDKSGRRKAESGWRKAEGGRRKEEDFKTQDTRAERVRRGSSSFSHSSACSCSKKKFLQEETEVCGRGGS